MSDCSSSSPFTFSAAGFSSSRFVSPASSSNIRGCRLCCGNSPSVRSNSSAAATIIYVALPEAGNPGFLTVAAVFLASFTVAQLSHAPGGLGVLEVVFIKGMPEMDEVQVLAALLVFRLLYLLIPLFISIIVVIVFERSQLATRWARPLPNPD